MAVFGWVMGSVLLLSALYYGHWVVVQRRWTTVMPGMVYQSGAMTPRKLLWVVRVRRIDTVIDFRHPHEPGACREADALRHACVRYVNLPCGRLPEPDVIQRFVKMMEVERRSRRRVLLHCKDGQGRAVFFSAIFRMEFLGWTSHEAYYGARRLPPVLRWLILIVPQVGLLSAQNPKTGLILRYAGTRHRPSAPTPAAGFALSSIP